MKITRITPPYATIPVGEQVRFWDDELLCYRIGTVEGRANALYNVRDATATQRMFSFRPRGRCG